MKNAIKSMHFVSFHHFYQYNIDPCIKLNNSKQASPGPTHSGRIATALTLANRVAARALAARDADKQLDDPNVSPVNTARRNALNLTKSSWSRVMNREKLHPFKMIR